jgi:hypothetical protein
MGQGGYSGRHQDDVRRKFSTFLFQHEQEKFDCGKRVPAPQWPAASYTHRMTRPPGGGDGRAATPTTGEAGGVHETPSEPYCFWYDPDVP